MNRPSFRHPESLVLLVNFLAVAAILASLLTELMQEHSEAMRQAEERLRHFSAMLAEQTERSLGNVDTLLNELSLDLSYNRPEWPGWDDRRGWEYLTRRHSRSLPQARDLILFDADGRQRFVSTKFPPPAVNIADRPYFQALKAGADKSSYGPYIGRNTGRYTFALARALKTREGAFAGVVFAALESAYFQDFCWPNRLHDDFDAFIINSEGKIVASCRPADISAQSPVLGQTLVQVLGLEGFAIGARTSLASGRIVTLAPIRSFPELMIVSSLPETIALQHWRKKAGQFTLFALLIVGILCSGGWLLRQQIVRLKAAAAALHDYRHHLEARIRTATTKLAAQKEEAEQASIAKSRFLAAASHDLRQPLHALSLFTSDLQRQVRAGLTRDLDPLAGQINESVLRLKEVFASLLDISRLDLGQVEPQPHPFPLQEVLRRVQLLYRRAALSRRVTLRIHPSTAWIHSDEALVERILSNLVSNAVRYTANAGRVLVIARRRQDWIRIEVRDNGPGIAESDQPMIFKEFFQLANPERDPEKGLGLGLPIVQRLVRTLGGKLELHSRPGCGTTFAVHLPAAAPATQEDVTQQPPLPRLILMAKCPELTRIAELATAWGYRCTVANDPDNLTQLRRETPAIVFAPLEQASQLRSDLPEAWPVVIVTTGQLVAGEHVYALQIPIRPARLRALLERFQKTLLKSMR